MCHISIISSSIRNGRKSHNVALYLQKYIKANKLATTEILDLKQYNFPLFDERLKNQKTPSLEALEFKNKIISSDGIIIVTPEYNGSIPASLKNIIDLLYDEWQKKTIAFSTVTAGDFGGLQAISQLQFIFWKIGALCISKNFPISKVHEKFDDFGVSINKQETDAFAQVFIDAVLKTIEASQK